MLHAEQVIYIYASLAACIWGVDSAKPSRLKHLKQQGQVPLLDIKLVTQ